MDIVEVLDCIVLNSERGVTPTSLFYGGVVCMFFCFFSLCFSYTHIVQDNKYKSYTN